MKEKYLQLFKKEGIPRHRGSIFRFDIQMIMLDKCVSYSTDNLIVRQSSILLM